jgi:hypothetical protein
LTSSETLLKRSAPQTSFLLGLIIIHQLTDAPDIDIDRAKLHASSASYTGHAVSIFIDIIFKLMHESLPDPLNLFPPRVMAGTMKGK